MRRRGSRPRHRTCSSQRGPGLATATAQAESTRFCRRNLPQRPLEHLDRLAAEGTLFENGYANCPICVPSRASFATGRYVHEIGYWDNAFPYTGTPPSFGHRLREHGRRCDSIGKLHYRGSDDPNGFDNEILPLHVLDGKGDVQGMLREDPPRRTSTAQLAGDAGAGESTYLDILAPVHDGDPAPPSGDNSPRQQQRDQLLGYVRIALSVESLGAELRGTF